MLLHEVVEFAAVRTPDAVALIFEARAWTFAELWADVQEAAVWLAERTELGDRIAIVSDNRPEVVVLMYAAPMAGVIAMFANTRLVESEINDLIADVTPVLVLRTPELDALLPSGALRRQFLSPDRSGAPVETDTAWIIHTSGTTGRPKGAMLTHRSLMAGVMATALARPVGPDDTYLFPFPLFHVASYGVVHLHFRGRPVVLVPKFDAVPVMAAIERHRVTTISLAPTMIAMLLDHQRRADFDLTSLRNIFYGASAIPLDVLRRGLVEFGCGFGQGYGMTELSGNAVFLDADDHRRAVTTDPQLLAAAGRVGPLAAVKLADDGEILIRGDQVVPGYWNRPEANDAAFVDGWFRTGDIGRFDDEGYLSIVDRSKDIIVSGGENVASLEVEDVLSEHPAVGAVAVVGVPDERWGERVVAVAVARAGAALDPDEVVAWCTGRLAGFKRPRQMLVVDALPTNASGKVLKREVRVLAAERLT
ncbi:MAG: AMP-binding protein [Microthrixaceae bacterium]